MEQYVLEQADRLDNYQTACQRDALNARARRQCDYVPWHDQSDGYAIQKTVGSSVHVIIMNPSADAGMPHTRAPNVICFPAYFSKERLPETLHHEMIHIYQRQNPEAWKERLVMEGWSPVSEWDAVQKIPREHLQRVRLNPDTIACRFQAWEGRYVPLCLFEREDKPNLRETTVRWFDLENGKLRHDPPNTLIRRYGQISKSAQEHPFELWAYSNDH
jgi:hypothetical protein